MLNNLDFYLKIVHFQAFDQHLNMILSEVEETITTVEIDEETFEELFKVRYTVKTFAATLSFILD